MSDYEQRIAAFNRARQEAQQTSSLRESQDETKFKKLAADLGSFLQKSGVLPLPVVYTDHYQDEYTVNKPGLFGVLRAPIVKHRVLSREVKIAEGWIISDTGMTEMGQYHPHYTVLTRDLSLRTRILYPIIDGKIMDFSRTPADVSPGFAVNILEGEQVLRDVAGLVAYGSHDYYNEKARRG